MTHGSTGQRIASAYKRTPRKQRRESTVTTAVPFVPDIGCPVLDFDQTCVVLCLISTRHAFLVLDFAAKVATCSSHTSTASAPYPIPAEAVSYTHLRAHETEADL
eukprot:640291-Rhodomonas_salina.3